MKIFIAAHRYQTYNVCFLTQVKAREFISNAPHPAAYQIFEAVFPEVKEIYNEPKAIITLTEYELKDILIKCQDDLIREISREIEGSLGSDVIDDCIDDAKKLRKLIRVEGQI